MSVLSESSAAPPSLESRPPASPSRPFGWQKALYLLALAACCLPFSTPPIALALGLTLGIAGINPWRCEGARASKFLLKLSVVGLGFGMNPATVAHAGQASFVYTFLGISFAILLGMTLGRVLSVPFNSGFLISAGTAICGGSAIAAVSPVVNATEEETAVSLTTVFVLNSIALVLFPAIGRALGMTQSQFGLWSALAIHDTSSVVGAGLRFGPAALVIGATVKLVRSLWIVPLVLATAAFLRNRAKIAWPWFIAFFIAAVCLSALAPGAAPLWKFLAGAAKTGFSVTLFLIGSSLSLPAIRQVGWRPMAMGVLLWLCVSTTTLACIRAGWIGL